MNRKPSQSTRFGKSRRPWQHQWSYRPNLIPLEDRVLLSATQTIFTLDQNSSSLTLSGTIGSSNIQQQGAGSLVTKYSGSIVVQWDLTARTINFVSTGTAATAANSGNWQPRVGGSSGTAPANYGAKATISIVTANAAVRGLVAAASTSNPLTLSGAGPYTFPSTQTLTITAGTADYNAGFAGSGTLQLANNSAANQSSTAGTFQDLGSGNYRLTTPISLTITKQVAGMTATLHIIGTLVSNATIPVVNLGGAGGDYSTQVVATQGPVNITGPGATVTDAASGNLTSMTATLTNHPDGAQELLAANVSGTTLAASYNAATGVESISGSATPAVYQQVLRTVTYENRSSTPDTHDRLIQVVAGDGRNSSLVHTSTVKVSAPSTNATSLMVAGFPSPITAGMAGNVTVTAQDAAGHTATGYRGTVHFTSSDPRAVLPLDYTFVAADNGVHTFMSGATLKTVGIQSITATDTVTRTITGMQGPIVVNAAAADHFIVTTSAANPDIAGTAFDVTVTVQDAYTNTVTGYTGTVAFSSADPQATLPPNYTFQSSDQGQVTLAGMTTLYTAGTDDVTATDTAAGGVTGSANVNVQAAPAAGFYVAAPSSTVSGAAFDVTIYALDNYGNVDTNYAGTVTWTSSDSDPNVVLPADYAFQSSDQGVVTYSGGVTLITLGDQTITPTDTVSGITGSATVTVTNGTGPNRGQGRGLTSEPAQNAAFLDQSALDHVFATQHEEQRDTQTLAAVVQAVTHAHRGTPSHPADAALLDDLAWASIV